MSERERERRCQPSLPVALPRYIVLKSVRNKYLEYKRNKYLEYKPSSTVDTYSGDDVFRPEAKFEVVPPTAAGVVGVHLRSCYSTKYLRVMDDGGWVGAVADKPIEDSSDWKTTLFEPLSASGQATQVHLRHAHNGCYATMVGLNQDYTAMGLLVRSQTPGDAHTVIDWESLVSLPAQVALKADNGNYASVQWHNDRWYAQFVYIERGDKNAVFRVTPDGHGNVCLRTMPEDSLFLTTFSDGFVIAHYGENGHPDVWFRPVKLGDSTIALKSLENGKFCSRASSENDMVASNSTITASARLAVEDMVVERKIYNAVYHLDRVIVYGETPVSLVTSLLVNDGTTEDTQQTELTYKADYTTHWTAACSLSAGITTKISFGIPLVADGEIQVSYQISGSYEWGEEEVHTDELKNTYTVHVPPKSSLRVGVIATKAQCDVPFSYTQRDVLCTGETVIQNKHDGIFRGVNSYNFQFHTEVPKPINKLPSQFKRVVPAMTAVVLDSESRAAC